MPHRKSHPGSPEDWLSHARSDLALADITPPEHVMLEALCFHAQQAVEKALKALLISRNIPFPRTHNIGTLVDLVSDTISIPKQVEEASVLTDYAVITRYPTDTEAVEMDEYKQAVDLARTVLDWVRLILESDQPGPA